MNFASASAAGAALAYPQGMPGKIEAAMDFLRFARSIEAGSSGEFGENYKDHSRPLTEPEKRCYDAAISTLTEYFNTDGFEDRPSPDQGGSDDGPKQPEKQPA